MPVKPLRANPTLAPLAQEAFALATQHAASSIAAAQRLREFHPGFRNLVDDEVFATSLSFADSQLTVAHERGFETWASLTRRIEHPTPLDDLSLRPDQRIADPIFRRAVELLDAGDLAGLKAILAEHPGLVHQHVLLEGSNYFRSPTLLGFIAENPVRHGKLPDNIVQMTELLLVAGPRQHALDEALMLVATGSVSRESGQQRPLIKLLCNHGADPAAALHAAAILDEHDAVLALLEHGAALDLPVAAALGRTATCEDLLPASTPQDRHLALAAAAQFGHADIVLLLLEAGTDPNRFNPPGGHSHATPLHLAAGAGYLAVARLLVEHGANIHQQDILWHATPADWAAHESKAETEQYLRRQMKA